MRSNLELQEEYMVMLTSHLDEAVRDLKTMQDEELLMDRDARRLMSDKMDYISYLTDCINNIEHKIERLKEKRSKGRA